MKRSSLKILSIVPYRFLPAQAGGQKSIAMFNEHLSKQAELYCITTRDNDNRLASYTTIPAIPASRLRYINVFIYFKIRKYLRQYGITHIIVEHPYFGWLGWLLRGRKVKLIHRSHNIESIRWKGLGKWWWRILFEYEKLLCRSADFNFFVAPEDRAFAEKKFKLDPSKNLTVTYGISLNRPPSAEEVHDARKYLQKKHNLSPQDYLLLFNGAFDYLPNLKALNSIVEEINPRLRAQEGFAYKILICGKDIPADLNYDDRIVVAGFVDDIDPYLKGSHGFLAPITEGGGIKTKLVEALGYNLTCVVFASAAIGIPPGVTDKKMTVVENDDFDGFASAVVQAARSGHEDIPSAFFEWFFWPDIIRRAVRFLHEN